tara:strand:+ start:1261 stop:2016 length:756 start_codon:yes stop_codon:yes gene_type:complete
MINKKEKGFALVLSLVLLMAMTLMGGALIVITASDHKGNNQTDEYQQTFYVAETALFEGEKYILNQYLGPYKSNGDRELTKRLLPANDTVKFSPGAEFEPCFYSFSDINTSDFKTLKSPDPDTPTENDPSKLIQLAVTKSFSDLLYGVNKKIAPQDTAAENKIVEVPITNSVTDLDKTKLIKKEKERLDKFKYQYFITRVGSAPFKGYGSSLKKDATDSGNDGMAYRIYGCGNYNDGEIIVPLESTLILPK